MQNQILDHEIRWNAVKPELFTPGKLVWFYKRLGTMIRPGPLGSRWGVEVKDEGGVVRQFMVANVDHVKELPGAGDTVLDMLHLTAHPELSDREKRERIAEKWFADPQAGDIFTCMELMWLEIMELRADGSIVVLHHASTPQLHCTGCKSAIFNDVETLRRTYRSKTMPGYMMVADATLRPDYADHPLLGEGQSSPLCSAEADVHSKDS